MNDKNHPASPKPSKLLPHWQQVPKWKKSLEVQYSMSSSLICAFLICEWNQMHIPIYEYMEELKLYWGSIECNKKIKQENHTFKRSKEHILDKIYRKYPIGSSC